MSQTWKRKLATWPLLVISMVPAAWAQMAVSDVNAPGKTAVEGIITGVGFTNGSTTFVGTFAVNNTLAPYVVPAGKRLVIEMVNLRCGMAAGTRINNFVVRPNYAVPHHVAAGLVHESGGATDVAHFSHLMRLYANTGLTPTIQATRNTTSGSYSCTATWSGHEVAVP